MVTSIKHFENQRYALTAYVVMDNHVHVLVLPADGFALHRIVHSWKSFSAKQLAKASGRSTPVWQREYLDRIVRDQEELMQKAHYILGNPLKRWPDLQGYQWMGFGSCL